MENIKNVIFDLGGVIINIDVDVTFEKFASLSGMTIEQVKTIFFDNQLIEKHETNEFSDDQFRTEIKRLLNLDVTDAVIDEIWNSLLFDIPEERIELIHEISNKYRTFLLSNTNNIHFLEMPKILKKSSNIHALDTLFEKLYLSHQIYLRKPHAPIYQFVLDDSNLIAEETLFIDDTLANIKGAALLGINTIHIQAPYTIIDHLQKYV